MANIANIVTNGIAGPVYLVDSSGNPLMTTASGDGQTTGIAAAGAYLFNGVSEDRQRSNVDTGALLTVSAAAPVASNNSADQTNYNGRGVIVVFDMTSIGSNTGLTLTIQGKDSASGKYYTLLAGAAVTTNVINIYTVYPGGPATANVSANSPLPRTWRVIVTTSDTTHAVSYTVGASIIF